MSESTNFNGAGEMQEAKSNIFLGIIGAILGAALGAVLWVVIYQIGFVASIAGIAIVFCSYKGYVLLGKRKDAKGAVIAIIASLIILCIAHALCWGIEIQKVMSVDYETTLWESIKSIPTVLEATGSEGIVGFFRDLAIGVVLIGVGYFYYIRLDIKNANGKKEEEVEESEQNS